MAAIETTSPRGKGLRDGPTGAFNQARRGDIALLRLDDIDWN
ncbi:hypothetical protein [Cryobacterium sp. N19]|nr:hypothetical protein [Cryobacterium sp. N19]